MSTRLFWLSTLVLAFTVAGCIEATDSPVDVPAATTTLAFNAEGSPTVEFSVPDMMCPEGCGEKTKEILSGQPGAKEVMIDFEGKRAVVAVEPERFDEDAALAAMVDHGFDHTALKSDSSAKPQAAEAPVQ